MTRITVELPSNRHRHTDGANRFAAPQSRCGWSETDGLHSAPLLEPALIRIVRHAEGAAGNEARARTCILARILVSWIRALFASSSSPSQRSFQISLRSSLEARCSNDAIDGRCRLLVTMPQLRTRSSVSGRSSRLHSRKKSALGQKFGGSSDALSHQFRQSSSRTQSRHLARAAKKPSPFSARTAFSTSTPHFSMTSLTGPRGRQQLTLSRDRRDSKPAAWVIAYEL